MKVTEILSEKDMGKHNNATTGFKALAKKTNAKIAGAQFQKMKKAGQLEEQGVAEMRDKRDSYQRDYDSSVSGFGDQAHRDFKRQEMEHELGHETNNYAISINGKTWKVFGSRQEANRISLAMERKYPDKKISVHATGAPISENATAGATSSANIGTVVNPHHSPGKARGKKSYLGDPWGGQSGTKAPPQPKVVQPKNADGTAKNGLEMGNIFGSGAKQKR